MNTSTLFLLLSWGFMQPEMLMSESNSSVQQPQGLSAEKIVQAWENPGYRLSLTVAEQKMLPANPAGQILCANRDGKTDSFWTGTY